MIHDSTHKPVLLHEVLEYLNPKPGDFIIDGTVDGGGHAAAIAQAIGAEGKFLGVDWDEAMIKKTGDRFADRKNMKFVHGNYTELPEILKENKLSKADGLLLDLGFSSEQLEGSGRGFSFLKDEPLLMTYGSDAEPAWKILREFDERELAKMIFALSGEKFAMRIARAIKASGKKKRIETSGELARVIREAFPGGYERGRIDPATRTFQALRIYANKELENVKTTLANLKEIVKPGGRAVVISFHSLEDGIVKHSFIGMKQAGDAEILTKKPVIATEEETRDNPRSRSAKLRAITLLKTTT